MCSIKIKIGHADKGLNVWECPGIIQCLSGDRGASVTDEAVDGVATLHAARDGAGRACVQRRAPELRQRAHLALRTLLERPLDALVACHCTVLVLSTFDTFWVKFETIRGCALLEPIRASLAHSEICASRARFWAFFTEGASPSLLQEVSLAT